MPDNTLKDDMQENAQELVEKVQQEVEQQREPWYKASRKTRILILAYVAQFIAFTVLAIFVFYNPILPVDVTITKEFQENQSPWLKMTMVAVSFLGNQWILFAVLILLTALAFWAVHLRLEAIIIVSLSLVSDIVNYATKLLVGRPRPTAQTVSIFQVANGASFPSGHVMSYVAYFGLLFSFGIILFRRDRWWTYVLLIVPALMVVLVGPSRIYLGDHWASDVLGAYIFGGILLGITLWIYLALKKRGVLTPKQGDDRRHLFRQPFKRSHGIQA